MSTSLSPNTLSAGAGFLVSMLLFTIPVFFPQFKGFSDARKQGINILALLIVTIVIALLSCYTDIQYIECSQIGLFVLAQMFGVAATANAVTFVTGSNVLKSAANIVGEAVRSEEEEVYIQ